MAVNQSQRPKFYEEQYLGAADLTAAVDYGRVQQARHALGAHTWGIAIGLQLKETPQADGAVSVHLLPGYAWDGYGRPIVVLSPYKIPEEKFSGMQFAAAIDAGGQGLLIPVWLRYDESATQNPRPGFEGCETADQRSRIQETFRIEIGEPGTTDRPTRVTIATKSRIDAKTALQVFDPTAPLVYDESIPQQTFPEPQDRAQGLLPIGYVRWLPVLGQPGHFVARDDSGVGGAEKDSDKTRQFRRYIGVVTEEIEAADGVIRLRDRGRDPMNSFFQYATKDEIAKSSNDLVWVEGNLRVVGNTKLCAGKLDFRDQQGSNSDIPLAIQRVGDGSLGGRALQIVIGPDTDAQPINRLAVGPLRTTGSVDEKFVVLSNGKVGIGITTPDQALTIQGNPGTYLNVKGNNGAQEVLLGADDNGGIVSTVTNHDLQLRAGGNIPRMVVKADGKVGIGITTPDQALTIQGNPGTYLNVKGNNGAQEVLLGADDNGGIVSTVTNHDLQLRAGGNIPRMVVKADGKVGIGTTTPLASLQVTGGAIMPAVGNSATAGIQFPSDPAGGSGDQAFIRYYVVDPGRAEITKLLIGVNDNPADTLGFYQEGAERMTINAGNVGIGTTNPQNLLHVNGQASKPDGGFWTNTGSDASLKKNIELLTGALSKLLQLRGVRFEWKEPDKMGNLTGPQMGLVAQEVAGVFPEWISTARDGYMQLTIRGFEALTIEALRELHTEIETLKVRLDKLTESHPAVGTRPRQRRARKEPPYETRD